jgi:hypothetical protein
VKNQGQRIAIRFLTIIAKRLIDAVPVVGPYLSIGVDLVLAAREEIERESNSEISLTELKAALRSLTYAEAEKAVDSILNSPAGQRKIGGLSPKDQQTLRNQLLGAPAEIDLILRSLREKEAFEQATRREDNRRLIQEKLRAALEESKHLLSSNNFVEASAIIADIMSYDPLNQEVLRELRRHLRLKLTMEEYDRATQLAREILRYEPDDVDASKALRWISERESAERTEETLAEHHRALRSQLKEEKYSDAQDTIEKIVAVRSDDPEAQKANMFIEKKLSSTTFKEEVFANLLPIAIGAFVLFLIIASVSGNFSIAAVVGVTLGVIFVEVSERIKRRKKRKQRAGKV